jgi:hypothetical protein
MFHGLRPFPVKRGTCVTAASQGTPKIEKPHRQGSDAASFFLLYHPKDTGSITFIFQFYLLILLLHIARGTSSEAPPLVQMIDFVNYYNLSAKADKNKSGEALPLVQMIGLANHYTSHLPPAASTTHFFHKVAARNSMP